MAAWAVGTRTDDVTFRSRYVGRHVVLPGYLGVHDHARAEANARADGYRMSELDQAVFRARRVLAGGGRRAARLVRAAMTSITQA